MLNDLVRNLLSAFVFSALGIIIFIFAFLILDRVTPGSLWKEIMEEHNSAFAILAAGVAIGISIIIAASVN